MSLTGLRSYHDEKVHSKEELTSVTLGNKSDKHLGE